MFVDAPDHGGDGEVVDGGHVAQDGEHQDPSSEAGAGVDHAGDQGVAVAVVVELVVGAQRWESSRTNTDSEIKVYSSQKSRTDNNLYAKKI